LTLTLRPSSDVPGEIRFDNVWVAGPTVPGLDWHVVVTGPEISANHLYHMHPVYSQSNLTTGMITANRWNERIRFDNMPYGATVLEVGGSPVIDIEGPGPIVRPDDNVRPQARLTLRQGMGAMRANDGSYVNDPFILHSFVDGIAVSMLNPRIFADFIGGEIEWVEATSTISFNGPDSNGNNVTVSLTNNSNRAIVNNQNVDIATFAGASGPANSVNTIIIDGRSFVPLRFLANAFLLPINFQDGTVTLG